MTSEEWHDILTLLTIVILADRRVYKEEVEAFVKTVKQLNDSISPEIFMTEGMVMDWFKANRGRVRNLMIGRDAQKNIKDAIDRTRNVAGKQDIINVMQLIARADYDFHKSEHNVIRRAAYSWGVAYS